MTKADKEGQRKAPILRFKGFTDDWEQRKLSEMTQQVKRTSDSENPILTISAKNGWMDQKDRFNRVIAGKELKNYIELYKNELSYNHGNSKYAKFGIIYVQRKYEKALVPKVYHSFSMSYGDPRFIENLSVGHKLDKELSKLITSGARQDGLLNINKKSFYTIKLFTPSEQEQIKISNIIDVINHVITLYERKLKLLSQVKKYFLDNLFAEKEYPNLRFKGFTDAWEQRKLLKVCKKEDNKRIPIKEQERKEGNTPYFGANGIQGYIDGYTHDGTNILIAEDGANNVRNYPIKLITGKIWVNNHAHVLNVNTKTNNGNFLVGAIKKINFYRYLVGSSRYKLTAESLSQVKIEITEQSEQEKIGELFKSIEELLTLYESKKQNLNKIKNTLLNTMFI